MNKAELIRAVARHSNITIKEADIVVNNTLSIITQQLVQGERVQLVGFGAFEVRDRAPRKARNPRTGDPVALSSSRAPVFKAGKTLKDAISRSATESQEV